MNFKLDTEQWVEAMNWVSDHDCPQEMIGAIGGRTTFEFTPTNLGDVQVVKCACGASLNLTDYGSW